MTYSYQWFANDGTGDTDIQGAAGSTYTLVDDDEGGTIRVRVSFTDDRGNDETLTSKATASVAGPSPEPLTASLENTPGSHDGDSAFTFELRFSEEVKLSHKSLRDHAFDMEGGTVKEAQQMEKSSNVHWRITVQPESGSEVRIVLPATEDCSDQGAICTEDGRMLSTGLELVIPGPSSHQSSQENSAATGAPTITGTAQVSETLTAAKTGIADEDGLDNATFAYQWLADDAEISGTTGSTYTLVAADEGKAIKVRVSFTDDKSNDESLTSAATAAVVAAPPINSPATGAPTISGTVKVGDLLTAAVTGISDQDGLGNASFDYQWLADDTDIAGATGSTYILADADEGSAVNVQVSFTDDAGNEESLTSEPTAQVAARPNSPATGAPTISGTARVGETLTADTSGISDANGLANATFSYQWLADGADIAGATGDTYTLVDADEGRAFSVRVSFTDDAGNDETPTSAATEAVLAAAHQQTPEPPGAPQGLQATAASDTQIDLSWTAPDGEPTGYDVEWSADGSTNWTAVVPAHSGTDTTYSHTGLTAETAYSLTAAKTGTDECPRRERRRSG